MVTRFLQHAVVIVYLTITAAAFIFTMSVGNLSLLPYAWFHWNYGMMSPYQGDVSWNKGLMVEGELPNGKHALVDLEPYLPYGFGERNVRLFMRMFLSLGEQAYRDKFAQLGLMILDRERAAGRPYTSLTLRFDQWPRSPAGYEFLHLPLFTTQEFITRVQ